MAGDWDRIGPGSGIPSGVAATPGFSELGPLPKAPLGFASGAAFWVRQRL